MVPELCAWKRAALAERRARGKGVWGGSSAVVQLPTFDLQHNVHLMKAQNFEAGINAIVGVGAASLARWGGSVLELPTMLTFVLMLVSAFACGWLLGALRKRRQTGDSNGS